MSRGYFFIIFVGTNINLCIMAEKKESYSEEELNIMQAKQCLGNYKMAGAFRMLQQIRENLENNHTC